MSIFYTQRVRPLKALYDKIESICTRHVSISCFECGDVDQFGAGDYTYPLVYLETIQEVTEGENKQTETYTVALNVCDRHPSDISKGATVQTHDRLKQIFTEIKMFMELDSQFGHKKVSPASITIANDLAEDEKDSVIQLRGEFTITVNKLQTSPQDLLAVFRPESE